MVRAASEETTQTKRKRSAAASVKRTVVSGKKKSKLESTRLDERCRCMSDVIEDRVLAVSGSRKYRLVRELGQGGFGTGTRLARPPGDCFLVCAGLGCAATAEKKVLLRSRAETHSLTRGHHWRSVACPGEHDED